MSDTPPLTPEERTLLAELQLRDAMEQWQEQEDARLARLARLAVFTPLDGAIDLPLVLDRIAAVETASGDFDTKNRIHRLRTILSTDMRALIDELERLKTPAPMPVAEPEQEPV